MFQNILVAVDGSRDADQALRHAIDLGESEHARLSVVTVVEPLPWGVYPMPGAPIGELTEDRPRGRPGDRQASRRSRASWPAREHPAAQRPIDPECAGPTDHRRPPRSRRDRVAGAWRGPLSAAWQRQPLRPEPQPRPGSDRSRTPTRRRWVRHDHRSRIAATTASGADQ